VIYLIKINSNWINVRLSNMWPAKLYNVAYLNFYTCEIYCPTYNSYCLIQPRNLEKLNTKNILPSHFFFYFEEFTKEGIRGTVIVGYVKCGFGFGP
jgi:hypothetical protein